MTPRLAVLAAAGLSAAVLTPASTTLHGQQAAPPANQPAMQMMATMRADDQKIDALVKKMNAATGAARVDAMAELLTALVDHQHAMHQSMQANMSMMMGTMHGRGDASTPQMPHQPQK